MSTKDQVLLSRIQVALIEPRNGGQSFPSQLWGRDEVIAISNQRQQNFLHETLLLLGLATITPVNIGDHRIALPSDWIRTVTAVWRGNDGTVRELMRSDSFETDHILSTWEATDATPLVYHEMEAPNGFMQIAPGPSVAGAVDLLYVPQGVELNGNGELLTVPDELEHTIRYGVLADLLGKDGRGKDPTRAAYCEQRVQLGIDLTKIIIEGWS